MGDLTHHIQLQIDSDFILICINLYQSVWIYKSTLKWITIDFPVFMLVFSIRSNLMFILLLGALSPCMLCWTFSGMFQSGQHFDQIRRRTIFQAAWCWEEDCYSTKGVLGVLPQKIFWKYAFLVCFIQRLQFLTRIKILRFYSCWTKCHFSCSLLPCFHLVDLFSI